MVLTWKTPSTKCIPLNVRTLWFLMTEKNMFTVAVDTRWGGCQERRSLLHTFLYCLLFNRKYIAYRRNTLNDTLMEGNTTALIGDFKGNCFKMKPLCWQGLFGILEVFKWSLFSSGTNLCASPTSGTEARTQFLMGWGCILCWDRLLT